MTRATGWPLPSAPTARSEDIVPTEPIAPWQMAMLIAVVLAALAWARPLMLPDEGRYVGVAWEMMRSGDWVTPTLDGLPFFHKPPLFYWITAAAMSLFGAHPFAARTAPLLGGWIGCFGLYLFARRWSGERVARLGVLALLVQPLFFIGAQFANLDMLVAGLITVTILLLADAALTLEHGRPHRWTVMLAYVAAAAGLLAKGLIGVVLPAMVVAGWLVWRGRWRTIGRLLSWPGLLVFGVLAAPWFVVMAQRYPDFLHYFFVIQHVRRFASGGFNNVQPFWFYPALLLLFWLPTLPWMRRALQRGMPQDDSPATGVRALMVIWVLVVVGFFSVPQSKLIGYVLPALPPLAWLAASGHALASESPLGRWARRGWTGGLTVLATLGIMAVVALAIWPRASTRGMSEALGALHHAGEPVVMLRHYDYDLAFYARLSQPAIVVDQWAGDQARAKDNWRKELADAGDFAPAAARQRLVGAADLPRLLCAAPVAWAIGGSSDASVFTFLAQARVAHTERGSSLWRLDLGNPALSQALGCAGTPTAGSASR